MRLRHSAPGDDGSDAGLPSRHGWILDAGLLGAVLAMVLLALFSTMTMKNTWAPSALPHDSVAVAVPVPR
jgi:hypothetical protein